MWKRRELKNAEKNEVFSFQMFQRHDDRFYVIVKVLKRLGDRYYIYMLFYYKEILLSNIRFLSNFVQQIPACLVILQDYNESKLYFGNGRDHKNFWLRRLRILVAHSV